MKQSKPIWQSKILNLAEKSGYVSPCDVECCGIPAEYLRRFARRGVLKRVGRELYAIPGSLQSESRQIAEVVKRVPQGVVCLLSAL